MKHFLRKKYSFRQIDGSGMNPVHQEYGKTGQDFQRIAPAEYADGVWAPAGANRAGPREVSNLLCAQPGSQPNKSGLSNYAWLWGQFIDHDITLTKDGNGDLPITVPTGDPHFDPNSEGGKTIAFTRSGFNDHGPTNPRQQFNSLSPVIDGSMVYGNSEERNKYIRAYKNGELLVSEGYMLPIYTGQAEMAGNSKWASFFAGDVRANEHLGLTALHTLFVREHNRWARKIKEQKSHWNDEQIYQHARVLVEATLQHITYHEFLPAILGRGTLRKYQGFDPQTNPQLANEFSTAAYRFGHSMVSSDLYEPHQLRDAFFSSHLLCNEGGIDPVLVSLAGGLAQELDSGLVDDLRNLLFGPPGAGGHDLAALNIQRGREHGLAHYNAVRVKVGLPPITEFEQLAEGRQWVLEGLQKAYPTVDDIDLWVGGLLEKHVEGSQLGQTFHRIVKRQFEDIRDGDSFWYEWRLPKPMVAYVKSRTLRDVILDNTYIKEKDLEQDLFRVSHSGSRYKD